MPNPVGEPVLHFWYCFIRVRTTCRLLNSRSFPGVFQGINKKIQDPKVVNFTSIFFHTSYLQKKNGPKKYFLFLQLSLIDKFKEFSRSWCQNWIFKEFSRVLEKNSKFQEFSRNSRSSGDPVSYAVHGSSKNYFDETPKCDYSVEKYWAVTFHGAVNCALWGGSNQAPGFDRPYYTVVGFLPSLSVNVRLRLTLVWYKLPSFSHGNYA